MPTPTPPPVAPDTLGLPLGFWANLPLIVCSTFAVVILVGVIALIVLNRRDALRRAEEEADIEE